MYEMLYLVVKSLLSGAIIMMVSEIARRSPSVGGLVASLPLISVVGIIWLWRDTYDVEKIAVHAQATFWFVLPSLPMFLVLPLFLRHGTNFWVSLILCCMLTAALYSLTIWLFPKAGIKI